MDTPFQNKWIVTILIPLFGGMLYASAFPMSFAPSFPLGTILGMSLLFYSLSFSNKEMMNKSLLLDIVSVLAFSVGYNTLGYYWIPETLKVFGEIPFPVNWMLGIFFSLIITPHLILFTVFHRYYKRISVKSSSFVSNPSSRNILYATILTLFEYFTPQQFPAHIGHSWLHLAPNLGLAPIFGVPLFSFLNFWMALALISKIKFKRWDHFSYIVFTLVLLINIFIPLKQTQRKETISHQVRLVQPNIGNFLKISSENGKAYAFDEVFEKYYRLSTQDSSKNLDLIVWPETAYPRLLNSQRMKDNSNYSPKLIRSIMNTTGAELFTGGYDRSSKKNDNFFQTEYNTAFHFNLNGTLKNKYHKIKLIPFGEGLPFGPLNQYIAKYVQSISFFANGEDLTLFRTIKNTPFVSAICYEILFSSFIRHHLNTLDIRPQFLINLTNDSWYGKTAEPYQHLFLSKWRALEFQLPIIRMTNTGVTSIIYANGEETPRSDLFVEAVQDLELVTSVREKTIFQRFGIWITIFFSITLLLITVMITKLKTSKN
jgi:apolipoprotein N-acyltransferase